MPQQQPGSTDRYGTPQPDDDGWDEDDWQQHGSASPPWPAARQAGDPGGSGRGRGIRPVTVGVIAVIAALAAAVVMVVLLNGHSSAPSAATGSGNAPAGGAPAQGGGGALGGGGSGQLFFAGTVTKVSSTSITLSGQGHAITAAITSSTQFGGSVQGASGIKVGDTVGAAISGYDSSHPVASSISDPPQMP